MANLHHILEWHMVLEAETMLQFEGGLVLLLWGAIHTALFQIKRSIVLFNTCYIQSSISLQVVLSTSA